eukprot:296399-Karenia_brevis.AAC.1
MFKEKFDNVFAASKWVEKEKKQRRDGPATDAEALKAKNWFGEEPSAGSKKGHEDVELSLEEKEVLDENEVAIRKFLKDAAPE